MTGRALPGIGGTLGEIPGVTELDGSPYESSGWFSHPGYFSPEMAVGVSRVTVIFSLGSSVPVTGAITLIQVSLS